MNETVAGTRAEDEQQARGWRRVAGLAALSLVAGSLPYLGCAFTFGLISGAIVLLIPLYVVLVHVTVVVIAVSLSLALRRFGLARVSGALLSLGPATALGGWYARQWWRCEHAPDSAACFQYLNGSPLLPITVVGYAILSVGMAAVVLFVIGRDASRARARAT